MCCCRSANITNIAVYYSTAVTFKDCSDINSRYYLYAGLAVVMNSFSMMNTNEY